MESIRINSGVRIAINNDPDRVIEFNPSDVAFAERFYQLLRDFEVKQVEYQERGAKLNLGAELDEYGLPKKLDEALSLLREVCEFMRERIDHLFGAGTSEKAFGDSLDLDLFDQFFEGIMPFIKTERTEKIKKYTRKHGKVMK